MTTTFKELVRQPTGKQMCDSGDFYGRHWESPLPGESLIVHTRAHTWTDSKGGKHFEVSASINLHVFLDTLLEIDERLTKKMRAYESENEWLNIFEAAEFISKVVGKPIHGKCDYTYNYENDLTQNFQFAVLSDKDDWFYDDDAIVLIQSHNGCDARGGFSDVVACRGLNGSDSLLNLLDLVVGWNFESGTDSEGNELSQTELQRLSECFEVGYSNNPTYHFNKAIESVVESKEGDSVITVTLKTGETVKAYANCRAEY